MKGEVFLNSMNGVVRKYQSSHSHELFWGNLFDFSFWLKDKAFSSLGLL